MGAVEPRWHYRRSLASRVIWLTTIAVGLAVAGVAFAAFMTARMQMQASLDESLLDRAEKAAFSGIPLDAQVPSWALGAADIRIIYITSDQRYQTFDRFPPIRLGEPEFDVAQRDSDTSIRTLVAEDGERFRVVAVPARSPGQALVLAQSLEPQLQTLTKLGFVMLFFGAAGVIAAGAAGWAVARNGLRPVRRLTAEVEEIARTQDLRPLPVEGDDEIARLAAAFNELLTALAASRDRQRQLVADAGHELRTPLTSLRTNLDLLAQAGQDLPETARGELLADVRAQIEELTTLIGDLVELARDEHLTPVVERVDLDEVVDRALARVRRRAPGLGFDVDTDHWWVVGDAAALERAVTNLLDNAAKWSPPEGTVTVRLRDGALVVDDAGPGIADADLPHVFERFWRAEESRSLPGSGLGLAIVAQVVERHSGSVTAGDAPGGGARFVVRLPGSPSEDPAPVEVTA
ncbi:HAMP domain-containing sensor histidine kinase [Nocardioides coralli]|uniref:HAMP domain-containing sensor histidine kinase n=1 Tax=Nocardioides coralli TaxID=2872154 RepID=UPI001CA3C44E|nr:HAMP domain-containing sensor histidine kinase [Nocardioides coralli]QZY28989.1 HAMP domain-containing histidine kinase [Nocardioides coralli]